jgi:hypothetical protein
MTEGELRTECDRAATTIVAAYKLGYEFVGCRCDDDGCKGQISNSPLEFSRRDGWRSTGAIPAIYEVGGKQDGRALSHHDRLDEARGARASRRP